MKLISRVGLSFASIALVGIALLADAQELDNPVTGTILWALFFILGLVVVALQARRTKVSPLISLVALIPYFNLILIPITCIVLAFLPDRKTPSK